MSLSGASGFHYAETAEDTSRDLALDGAAYSAPTCSVRTLIWSLRASNTAGGPAIIRMVLIQFLHFQQTSSGLFRHALAERADVAVGSWPREHIEIDFERQFVSTAIDKEKSDVPGQDKRGNNSALFARARFRAASALVQTLPEPITAA